MASLIIKTIFVSLSMVNGDSYGTLGENSQTVLKCPEGQYVGFTLGEYFTNQFSADVTRALQINCCNIRSCSIKATNTFLGIDPHVGRRKTLRWNMTCEDSLGLCVNRPCGNGTCTSKNCVSFTCSCFSGYHGNLCEFECGNGTFGPNCTKLCGQCKDGVGNCDHVTGVCSKGCDDWYIGNNCDIKCPEGICGTSCTKICGEMTPTRNNQSQHCDECCALCFGDGEALEVTEAPHSSGKCSLEVYGLLAALIVSLVIHFGVLIMYILRLRLNKKDISSGTTPMYANVKSAESSIEHLNQKEQSTAEINIYYESLQNSAIAQDIHDYASLGK